MSYCITVLTRGYQNINKYSNLIKRNKSIQQHLNNKNIDILIFHEGNITDIHQIYIKKQTPLLKIIFVNILSHAFKESKKNIKFSKETEGYSLGYRHMCDFWFVSFWSFVKEYDYLLRIDEDCVMNTNIDDIFYKLQSYLFISGIYDGDIPYVTRGLNDFTLDFINKHPNYQFKNTISKSPGGPYTNLFGISLDSLRTNEMLQTYIQEIDNSNMIYERRWGDLPLWGESIYYICGENTLLIDNTIQYFHGSHNFCVNFANKQIKNKQNKNKNKNNKNKNNNNNNNQQQVNQLRQIKLREIKLRQMRIKQMKLRQMKIRQMKIRQMKIKQMRIRQMRIRQMKNKK
jgi:hypothetical protein